MALDLLSRHKSRTHNRAADMQCSSPDASCVAERPSPRLGDGLRDIIVTTSRHLGPYIAATGHGLSTSPIDSTNASDLSIDTNGRDSVDRQDGSSTPLSSFDNYDTLSDCELNMSRPQASYRNLPTNASSEEGARRPNLAASRRDDNYRQPSIAHGLANTIETLSLGRLQGSFCADTLDRLSRFPEAASHPVLSLAPVELHSIEASANVPIAGSILIGCSNEKSTSDGARDKTTNHTYLDICESTNIPCSCGDHSGQPLFTNPPRTPNRMSPASTTRMSFQSKLATYTSGDTPSIPGSQANVHVFVDISNIFIGFCETYRVSRQISRMRRMRAPFFSFKVLACIMERTRSVTKRVLAGSADSGDAPIRHTKWPGYFLEAEQLNYDMNIFSRVQKQRARQQRPTRRGKALRRGSLGSPFYEAGVTSTDESTGDGIPHTFETRNCEQGVDENLHLNMMNSILDHMSDPGTMVLATGDAALAEFSAGFFEYACRALSFGWKLELVAWRRNISSSWTNPSFVERYSDQFRIIFLDDFLEELHLNFLP
ncbi:hypothetical protein GGS23DRAFT_447618 [Durotheca rogersii]|uniref:uncharacterized protein n=1 Tax=Durotheca rogersii TaxID=419775 RepID=UPI002220F88A|nr:uncharacterized protein GGS23DRAFT_447618 [Durotheca rogersii]KAI5855047.1 hypothetical protein GGS23DRAFT_447618 [Durotheca rogersii]